jgi:hypothetical protein
MRFLLFDGMREKSDANSVFSRQVSVWVWLSSSLQGWQACHSAHQSIFIHHLS